MLRFLRRGYATAKLLRVLQLRAAQLEKVNAQQEWPANKVYSDTWEQYTKYQKALEDNKYFLEHEDPDLREIATQEREEIQHELEGLVNDLPRLLLPQTESTSHLSALLELKIGVGGTESSLFLTDMLRMYTRYSATKNWAVTTISMNENDAGGAKEAIVEIKGRGAYDALRWESGVHRVQRVPATESGGRTHTSTVAAIVLPLAEEKDSQNDPLFSMDDVKIEVMRARGAGGQHVNKTESAVRLTHIPTGITVSMQDERSQHQNKRRAFQVLTARLLDVKLTSQIAQKRETRNTLVRSVDRSEKIRTYNYAQERVTDHRIGLTKKNLSSVLDGESLQVFIDALKERHRESLVDEVLESEEEKLKA